MRIIDVKQGTDEWKQARCGRITASRMSAVMATIKSGEAAERRNYRAELICETLTNQPTEDGFQSDAMKRGIELEDEARQMYCLRTMQDVTQVGLVLHPTNDRIAASPDGIVGLNGLLEIKCPLMATHLNYMMMGVPPAQYRLQMMTQLLCCERDWVDFVSYCPQLPIEYQMLIYRFHRDDQVNKDMILMEAAAITFLSEVDATIAQLPKCVTIKL